MIDPSKDSGTIQALLDRLNDWRLPRMFDTKAKVDAGKPLDSHDMQFLKGVMADSTRAHELAKKNPELKALFVKVTSLYQEITKKALENEGKK